MQVNESHLESIKILYKKGQSSSPFQQSNSVIIDGHHYHNSTKFASFSLLHVGKSLGTRLLQNSISLLVACVVTVLCTW